jgi:hypothetical protein
MATPFEVGFNYDIFIRNIICAFIIFLILIKILIILTIIILFEILNFLATFILMILH